MSRTTAWTLAFSSLLLGCPAEPVVPDTPEAPWVEARLVTSLAIDGDTEISLARGETVALSLSAYFDDDESPSDVTAAATWQVADPSIAMVTSDGTIEGLLEGFTTVWGEYAGIRSASRPLEVGLGPWDAEVSDGGTGVQGKLLDVELFTDDTTFDVAESIELSVDGLIPFGQERVEEPWWGVPEGEPNRYRARFLVPPTATPGAHDVFVTIDGKPPTNALSIQITANTSFASVRDCDYFENEPSSNWTFQAEGNNSRSWLFGDLARSTNSRLFALSNGSDGVDPYLALWSLTGELLATSDDDPEYGLDGGAGLQVSSLEDVFEGAYYVTATISPKAVGAALGGTIATSCAVEMMPDPMYSANNEEELFGAEGATIYPGSSTPAAEFSVPDLTVGRVWVYLDLTMTQADYTTVTLWSPELTKVELISPNWSTDWLSADGEWAGGLGGEAPFVPVASVWSNPTVDDPGTAAFAGESSAGTWRIQLTVNNAGEGGVWRDAMLFVGAAMDSNQ